MAFRLENEDRDGVRWIRLSNGFRVWTQRLGRGPKKILLLSGGPGLSHDYLQCFADFLPQAGFEMYFYDQLGCGHSDKPDDADLWTLPRYLSEVEEVRAALGLDRLILVGHSWGGILGIEYALAYPERLAGFVLSNMTASFADFGAYMWHLRNSLPAAVRSRLDALEAAGAAQGGEYGTLIQKELYSQCLCRLDPWPQPVLACLTGLNAAINREMEGPDAFTLTGNLSGWDRWADLPRIRTPTLVIGARHDEMNPDSIRREASLIPGAQLFVSDKGSHLTMWDDQEAYFRAVTNFIDALPA